MRKYRLQKKETWKRVIPVILLLMLSSAVVFAGIKRIHERKKEQHHFELSEKLKFSITNADEVIETIHNGLTVHARSFTITYNAKGDYSAGEAGELADELINDAMYNTESPIEGHYVRYQYGGYRLSYEKSESENAYEYQLTITPVYYSTIREEQKVDEKTKEILAGFRLDRQASDLEKIQAVYDYVCSNVNYDHVHENNSHYYKDSTAYAALVEKSASCQGYAVAVFRLLKELGVECDVVTGTAVNDLGKEEFHAWNRVFVDGEYYNADATWDAGKEEYDYFMVKDEEFANHTQSDIM
jgi:hypothetical protein